MSLLPFDQLLARAKDESKRLQSEVLNLKTELFQMSQHYLRSGWNAGFEDYYHQRREVSIKLLYAERDLVRSQGREIILRQRIADGLVRERELAVAAT